MNIELIEIKIKLLYENRHLLTDDVEYNSLLLSNIFNQSIKLFDKKTYDKLNLDHQVQIVKETNNKGNILYKDGLYWMQVISNLPIYNQFNWVNYKRYRESPVCINIFTVV